VTWAGIALNRWARWTLAANYRSLLTVVADHEVVDRGPYRLVRHPMYLGSTLICAGVATILRTWPTAIAWMLPPLGLLHRIEIEEGMLAEELGGRYPRYAAERARLIPGLW